MSIKSQKSLSDECSEIFEKSYSVRSLSEESLATEEEEESLSRELLDKMTPAVLSRLRRRFKRTKDRSSAKDIHRKVEEAMHAAAAAEGVEFSKSTPPNVDTSLHWEGFVSAIDEIFGMGYFLQPILNKKK
ncbi:unnamed protein product [Parnassius mnemosyne]|uniref:Uncharacterized protein n=1 Tax=Parnassius mnemosyne TaxID=213953 RepID=A0AAV1L649_9NEOP